jgi:hypothetical protein
LNSLTVPVLTHVDDDDDVDDIDCAYDRDADDDRFTNTAAEKIMVVVSLTAVPYESTFFGLVTGLCTVSCPVLAQYLKIVVQ